MKKRTMTAIIVTALAVTTVTLPKANAAVAVFDAQNVAKAIETVTNTLNILNVSNSQLALEIANKLGLSQSTINIILSKQQSAKNDPLSGDIIVEPGILAQQGKKAGVLNKNSDPVTIINQQLGTINDIYNKNMSIGKLYETIQNNAKVMEATQKDAVTMAQNVQISDEKLGSSVQDAITAANNAEGHMQVLQANTAINAANVQSVQNGNQLLSQLVATEAVDFYVKNQEKAMSAKMLDNTQKELSTWVNNF